MVFNISPVHPPTMAEAVWVTCAVNRGSYPWGNLKIILKLILNYIISVSSEGDQTPGCGPHWSLSYPQRVASFSARRPERLCRCSVSYPGPAALWSGGIRHFPSPVLTPGLWRPLLSVGSFPHLQSVFHVYTTKDFRGPFCRSLKHTFFLSDTRFFLSAPQILNICPIHLLRVVSDS